VFPGQYFDSETGLHYNYFRYYDPGTGRYLTADAVGIVPDQTTVPFNLNHLFVYAGNNPINYVDQYGLLPGFPWPWPNGGPFGPVCGSGSSATYIPDGPFKEACESHDRCYSTCGANKTVCDFIFLLESGSPGYFGAVTLFGGSAYEEAQEEACEGNNCS